MIDGFEHTDLLEEPHREHPCREIARSLGRHAIGIELNPEYIAIAATRLQQLSLLGGAH